MVSTNIGENFKVKMADTTDADTDTIGASLPILFFFMCIPIFFLKSM